MIVVLAILVVVLTALTQLFVSASTAEVDMSKRFQAQQDARLALDTLRREIHCAKASRLDAGTPGRLPDVRDQIKLGAVLPVEHHRRGDDCHVVHGHRCTRSASRLWRYRTRQHVLRRHRPRKWADYLTTGQRCSRDTTPPVRRRLARATLSVDLPVDLKPADAKQRYKLKDDIVLRNTQRSMNRGRTAQGVRSEQPIGDKSWPPRLQHSPSFPGSRSGAS